MGVSRVLALSLIVRGPQGCWALPSSQTVSGDIVRHPQTQRRGGCQELQLSLAGALGGTGPITPKQAGSLGEEEGWARTWPRGKGVALPCRGGSLPLPSSLLPPSFLLSSLPPSLSLSPLLPPFPACTDCLSCGPHHSSWLSIVGSASMPPHPQGADPRVGDRQ